MNDYSVEKERKFLVSDLDSAILGADSEHITQWLPIVETEYFWRIRRVEHADASVTWTHCVKQVRATVERYESAGEPIPERVGKNLVRSIYKRGIAKRRYSVVDEELWSVDVFEGKNAPLVIAELEFNSGPILDGRSVPTWCGREVTTDFRFYNVHLWNHPFTEWPEGDR